MPFKNGVISVGTTPTLIAAQGSTPENSGVLIQNLGAVAVFLGGPTVTAGVTATGGLQLPASNTTPVNVPTTGAASEALYGIVASSTANVAYLFPG
jgi:hypothetical protein